MKLKSIISYATILLMSIPFIPTLTTASADDDNIIIASDFEDDSLKSWSMFGGGKIDITDEVAHNGTKCMKASERKQQYQGPSLNFNDIFIPGETYGFNAWLYHDYVAPVTMTWTIKYDLADGSTHYASISKNEVAPGEWVEFSGSVIVPEDAETYVTYFECMNAEQVFYVDDVTVSGEVSEAAKKPTVIEYREQYLYDFEVDTESWSPRGNVQVVHTDEYSNTGNFSLYTIDRKSTWNGPTVNVSDKIIPEKNYHYSASVMYNGAEYEDMHNFRLELQYAMNGNDKYNLIADKDVKKGKWTTIDGYFTVPEGAENIFIYVQTANLEEGVEATENDFMPFYIDTVTITDGDIMLEEQRNNLILTVVTAFLAVVIAILIAIFASRRVKKNKTALKLVSVDAMTQVFNRNSYEKKIEELENDVEQCKSLYFALCDVNFLKYINDNHGHELGDEAIARCAKMLDSATGSECKVYRTGGDEFVCISQVPIDEKVRKAIEEESKNDKGYPFAVACGFAVYDENDAPDVRAIIAKCDKEMYADKQKIKAANKEFSRK